jgi:DNA invertase Pin-like site-specific DNA recombinase
MSGKTLKRPELDRLRADACAGLVRKLYFYRLDWLTRSLGEVCCRDSVVATAEGQHVGLIV